VAALVVAIDEQTALPKVFKTGNYRRSKDNTTVLDVALATPQRPHIFHPTLSVAPHTWMEGS